MEEGVAEAFRDICRQHGLDWDALLPALLRAKAATIWKRTEAGTNA